MTFLEKQEEARREERKRRRGFIIYSLAVIIVFSLVLLYSYQYMTIISLNYQITHNKKVLAQLKVENEALRSSMTKEYSLERIKAEAEKKLGLLPSDPSQVVWVKEP
jgi:cell division protein FtsL